MTRARLAGALFVLLCGTWGANAQTSPPNVLFISVDDLNTAVGFMSEEPGNPLQMLYPDPEVRARIRAILSPNIDALASEGVPFAQTHAASAVCAPSRAALMTGVRPHTSGFYGGGWFRDNPILNAATTLPEHFKAEGYYTMGVGKIFHINRVDLDGEGEIEIDWPDSQRSWSDWVNYRVGHRGPTTWSPWSPGQDRFEFGVTAKTLEQQWDYENGDLVAQLLENGSATVEDIEYGERTIHLPPDTPFFLAAGIYRPHLPFVVPDEILDLFDPDDLALTDSLRAVFFEDTADLSPEGQEKVEREDGELVAGPAKLLYDHGASMDSVDGPVTAWKEAARHYLASIVVADRIVGRILSALDASPHADNTIVVLWGDHGYHLGEKSWFGKTTLWDESTQTVMIVRTPASHSTTAEEGVLRRQPASLMDLYPTLTALVGLPTPEHVEGDDLSPRLVNANAPGVSTALTTMGLKDHALRTEQYRIVRFDNDPGEVELYDVLADPEERTNLSLLSPYQSVRDSLEAALEAVLSGDPPVPAGSILISGGAGYRLLAPAAEGMTVADLAQQNLVAGVPGQYGTDPTTLYVRYGDDDWQVPTGMDEPLPPGRGLFWYFYDVPFTPAGVGIGESRPLPFVLDPVGEAVTTDWTVSLRATGNRFNVLGNPFWHTLDLTGIQSWAGGEHVSRQAFVWEPNGATWVLAQRVDPWQGFILRAKRGRDGESLTMPFSDLAAKGVEAPAARVLSIHVEGVEAETGRPLLDRSLSIRFDGEASVGLDALDVPKLAPLSASSLGIGALVGDALLMLDVRPEPSGEQEIPLVFQSVGAAPEAVIRWRDVPPGWNVALHDRATGARVDMTRTDRYTFRHLSARPLHARDAAPPAIQVAEAAGEARFALTVEPTSQSERPALALHPVAPNPARGDARVSFTLAEAGPARVRVFDARGREVAVLSDGHRETGRYNLRWETRTVAAGVYVVRLEAGAEILSRRLAVLR